jgi:hypothetical protein
VKPTDDRAHLGNPRSCLDLLDCIDVYSLRGGLKSPSATRILKRPSRWPRKLARRPRGEA